MLEVTNPTLKSVKTGQQINTTDQGVIIRHVKLTQKKKRLKKDFSNYSGKSNNKTQLKIN